jgi:hypothetical protein
MKKLSLAIFVLIVLLAPICAQSTSEQLNIAFWNSLSPEAKKAFSLGFSLGGGFVGKDEGFNIIKDHTDEYVAIVDKMSESISPLQKIVPLFISLGAAYNAITENYGDPYKGEGAGSNWSSAYRIQLTFEGLSPSQKLYIATHPEVLSEVVAENSYEEAERVPWLSLKLNPDKYAKDKTPKTILIDSIRLFDDFRETVVRLDDPDLTWVIYFKAKIENDILFTDNSVGWNFVVCMERDFGQRAIERMGKISPDKRVEGCELRNVKCQVYKIAYQKTWLIVLRDAD